MNAHKLNPTRFERWLKLRLWELRNMQANELQVVLIILFLIPAMVVFDRWLR